MSQEPGSGEFPIAFQSGDRDIEEIRRFGFGKAAEIAQLDNRGGTSIELGEPGEYFIECEQVGVPGEAGGVEIAKFNAQVAAASLVSVAGARVIDQNAAHLAGGNHEEVLTVRPGDSSAIVQPEIEFVDESGGLEGVSSGFLLEVVRGEMAEVGIGALDGVIAGFGVALGPAL